MKNVLIGCLLILASTAGQSKSASFIPKNGFVPDAATALAVAEAVLAPVYGKDKVLSEHPFKAILSGDKWIVTGSVPCDSPNIPCPGGAAEVQISKKSGRILYMTHYQ
jgi:hypothetical protein